MASPAQTAAGKDTPSPLIAGDLLKIPNNEYKLHEQTSSKHKSGNFIYIEIEDTWITSAQQIDESQQQWLQ